MGLGIAIENQRSILVRIDEALENIPQLDLSGLLNISVPEIQNVLNAALNDFSQIYSRTKFLSSYNTICFLKTNSCPWIPTFFLAFL